MVSPSTPVSSLHLPLNVSAALDSMNYALCAHQESLVLFPFSDLLSHDVFLGSLPCSFLFFFPVSFPVHSAFQCAVNLPFSKFWLLAPLVSTAPEHSGLSDPHTSTPFLGSGPKHTIGCSASHAFLSLSGASTTLLQVLLSFCRLYLRCHQLLKPGAPLTASKLPLPHWAFMDFSGFFHLREQMTRDSPLSLTRNFHGLCIVHS